jgi:hypothetical protein
MSSFKPWMGSALLLACIAAAPAVPAAESRAETFARLPNWTGQWQIVGVTPDATGGIAESMDDVLKAMRVWGPPPYKPDAKAIFDAIAAQIHQASVAAVKTGVVEGLRRPTCTFGFPAVMIHSPLMFEFLTTPEETALIFSGREMRHIYTDGRAHTAPQDLWPTFWGDSIGHWEGQTLVVDTIAVNNPPDGVYPPAIAAFGGVTNSDFAIVALLTARTRFVERIRMLDKDHLEDQMTIIDAGIFTKPWKLTRQFSRVKGLNRMVHEDCEGEDRNPIVNGQYTLAPPAPPPPPLPPPFGPVPEASSAK